MFRSPGAALVTPGHSTAYGAFQASRSNRSLSTLAGIGATASRISCTSGSTCSHPDVAAAGGGGRVRQVGQPEQVLPLGLVEQQGAGHRGEHLRARVDLAALFQPGVPGHADAGELRDLLAAQPRSPAARSPAAGPPARG